MADKNLTARPRSSRNSGEHTIHDAIETERSRLMTAEGILHCVAVAMDEYDPADLYSPDYQSLIDLSRELIKHAIDELDSVRVKPMLERIGSLGTDEVKETGVEYVH